MKAKRVRDRKQPLEQLTQAGLRRRATSGLPLARPCYGKCGKLTRSSAQTIEDVPNSVQRANSFYCVPCYKLLGNLWPESVPVPKGLILKPDEVGPAPEPEERLKFADGAPEHIVNGLTSFMRRRYQRQERSQRLAQVRNVATTNQPQPRGNGGSRVAAEAHRPRPVPGHQQVPGPAGVHVPGAPGRTPVLQRPA